MSETSFTPPPKSDWTMGLVALGTVSLCFAAGILLSDWPLPQTPRLVGNPLPGVLSALGILAVLAVFVERTVEVYAVSFREPGKILREAILSDMRTRNEPAALSLAQTKLAKYQTGTQKRAVLLALALGILFGLFGISILEPIFESVDPGSIPYRYLRVLDVIIVGGLLAGGADPIHQMIKALQDGAELSRANTVLAAATVKASTEAIRAKAP